MNGVIVPGYSIKCLRGKIFKGECNMNKRYVEKIPTLNNIHIWLLLADIYYQVEIGEDENYILSQLELAELLENELQRRNHSC